MASKMTGKNRDAVKKGPIDWAALLGGVGKGKMVVTLREKQNVFQQGDPSDAVFFIQKGRVRLSVTSEHGKEAIVATLKPDEFFGEGCLTQQPLRMAAANALGSATLLRVEKQLMQRLLHERENVAEVFLAQLLAHGIRCEEDLCDQLFNNSEKRLARVLLLLAQFGKDGKLTPVLPAVKTEKLAQMVGVSDFEITHTLNKFQKLGFVEVGDQGDLSVHSSLLTSILNE